jgi:hypothetical protein
MWHSPSQQIKLTSWLSKIICGMIFYEKSNRDAGLRREFVDRPRAVVIPSKFLAICASQARSRFVICAALTTVRRK